MRGPRLPALLLALAALLACAGAQQPLKCAFVGTQPRYASLRTTVTTLNVAPGQGAFFLSDALIRLLTRQLGLATCQVVLSQGEACSAALAAAPCPDPLWLCGSQLTVSNSVYQAARAGMCANASAAAETLSVCQTLRQYPTISQLAAAGACEPACFARLTQPTNDTAGGGNATLAPPPPPPAAGGCWTFQLQVDAASEAAATDVSLDLHNATTAGALLDGLGSFGAPGATIRFVVGDSDISTSVGFGYFPPPSPPPPPPPSPPPPSPPPPPPSPPPPSPPPPSPSPPPPSPPPPSPPPPSPPPPLLEVLPQPGNATNDPNLGAQSMEPDASLVYGPWSDCSASCGDGWQTRTATCLAADGSLLALQQCPAAADAVTSRACKGPSCTAPYWLYSAWSPCNATCGGGSAERNATCEAPKGKDCDSVEQQPLEQECNTAACAVFAWQAGEWSSCSAECGGGNQTRYVACVDIAGVVTDDQLCAAAARPADSRRCALQPCDFCSANDCLGKGTCSDGACVCDASMNVTGPFCQVPTGCGSGVVDKQLACCASGIVDASGACCPAGASLDASGACCAGGKVDACGVCGGKAKFVDTAGACCATLLDADGQCCASGAVDECGVCNGLGTSCAIEITLQLSVSPELVFGDAVQESALNAFLGNLSEALLLPEGALTLDSLQETAPSTSDLAISEAQGQERSLRLARLLLAAGNAAQQPGNAAQEEDQAAAAAAKQQGSPMYLTASVTLSPEAAAQTGGQFSAAWMSAALGQVVAEQPADSPVQLGTNNQITRAAVCGNGICEVGERTVEGTVDGSCPQDCSFETKACPESCGAGTCQPATGSCACFVGYTGDTCEGCTAGFTMVNGTCSADVVALGFVSPAVPTDEAGTQADASNNVEAASDGGGPNVGAIVGPIVAAVVAIAAAAAFVIHRRRSRAFLNFGTPSNSDGADGGRDLESQYTTAQGEVGTGSETRSLREKYGSMSSLGTGGAPTPPTQSAAPSGAPSAAPSAGTVSSGGHRLMQASQEALALRSSQQAFRGLAAGASQLSRGDSQLHSSSSMGGPARTRSTAGGPNPLRQSLTASTGCNGGGSTLSGSALVASAAAGATFASATPVLGDAHQTLKSVSSSGRGGSRPDSAAHSSSNNSGTSSGHSGQAQPAASALDSSHLMAESPAMVEAASMAVHPFMSPHPSMPVSPAQVAGGAPSMAHLAGVMMQSYTSSPLDPQARLFYNPAFNDESIPRMSDSKSVLSSSHVPKPGYFRRLPSSALVSAEPSSLQPPTASASEEQPASASAVVMAAAVAAEMVPAGSRRLQAVNHSMEESLDTQARRDKLDRLRAAVEALEADAVQGAGGKHVAGPGELQSPSGSQPLVLVPAAMRISVDSVTWAGKEEQEVSPLALSQTEGQHRKVLDRRPSVPRLPLGRLLSGDQGAQLPPVAVAAEEAATAAPEVQSRPAVPRLALSKLNPLAAGPSGAFSQAAAGSGLNRDGSGSGRWRPTAQVSRIPAANFSTLDANAHRSPTKLPSGALPADPLDDLDAMLDSATPQRQQSAREALASGLSKLLNPLLGSARGLGSARRAEDWGRQLSERGRGTPRSWAEDSGMQRTKAGVSLQRSKDELEEESPPIESRLQQRGGGGGSGSAQGPFLSPGDSEAPSSALTSGTATSLASRSALLSSSPRGQLLKQLADEATAAQRERAAREARAAATAQPTYSEVMGRVDDALRSAGTSPVKGGRYGASGAYSPSKLPRAASGAAAGGYRSGSSSPSKIPRGPSQRNSSADENANGGAGLSARISAYWQ